MVVRLTQGSLPAKQKRQLTCGFISKALTGSKGLARSARAEVNKRENHAARHLLRQRLPKKRALLTFTGESTSAVAKR